MHYKVFVIERWNSSNYIEVDEEYKCFLSALKNYKRFKKTYIEKMKNNQNITSINFELSIYTNSWKWLKYIKNEIIPKESD
ncbi:MAG TPA: hypothetical protein DEA28_02960 [Firmicutes bacterium]|nr:hypothetical protein [Bacillota bacterium]